MLNEEISREAVVGYMHDGQTHFLDKHCAAHALEDLPPEAWADASALIADHHLRVAQEETTSVCDVPVEAHGLRRLYDILENAALDVYGHAEEIPLFHFLSQYPVTSYTYEISPDLSRGERPHRAKLTSLHAQGYRATVNFCAEMTNGDAPNIDAARLTGEIETQHVPVVDMTPPTVEQVVRFLDFVQSNRDGAIYAHCEAGKARTGVMVACYRMAVMGWNLDDALTEARNFGCSVPRQQAFIEEFGGLLMSGGLNPGNYPLLPPGSVMATAAEKTATLASAAVSVTLTTQVQPA